MNETLQKAEWHLSDLHAKEEAMVKEMLDLHLQIIDFKRIAVAGNVLVRSSSDVWDRKTRELAELREDITKANARIAQVRTSSEFSPNLKAFLANVASSANSPHVSWRLDMQTHRLEARVTVIDADHEDDKWVPAFTPIHAVHYHLNDHFLREDLTFSEIGLEQFELTEDEVYAITCGCEFDFDDTETPSTALQRWVVRQEMLQRVQIPESLQALAALPGSLRELVSKGQS